MSRSILYVAQLPPGSTSLDRMTALQRLGHRIVPFDVSTYASTSRLMRRIEYRLSIGPGISRLNRDLIKVAERAKDVDLVWVDKGVWVAPDTLRELKRLLHAPAIHYTPDPQIYYHRSRLFIGCIPLYDFLVTTKRYELDEYRRLGARNLMLTTQSYSPQRFSPHPPSGQSEGLGLIAHYEAHYGRTVEALLAADVRLAVWGPGWPSKSPRRLRHVVAGDALWGEAYPRTLGQYRIGLGVLSRLAPDRHTTRTFEIPAVGSMLLAERTEEHVAFFTEGVDAEFYGDLAELVEKARYYLEHETDRMRIAAAGHRRCLADGRDHESVLRTVLERADLT